VQAAWDEADADAAAATSAAAALKELSMRVLVSRTTSTGVRTLPLYEGKCHSFDDDPAIAMEFDGNALGFGLRPDDCEMLLSGAPDAFEGWERPTLAFTTGTLSNLFRYGPRDATMTQDDQMTGEHLVFCLERLLPW
jgi:hypothetical protein